MDISLVAAVGSFFMSERVLKPKATILVILGLVLAYDLTTKTHDVSSLRVYRGPALLAFTLFVSAFSLRTWRRNGVACDELLFLPGTAHGVVHGVDNPPAIGPPPPFNASDQHLIAVPQSVVAGSSDHTKNNNTNSANKSSAPMTEGDVAAGGPHPDAANQLELRRRSRSQEDVLQQEHDGNPKKRGISLEQMRQSINQKSAGGDLEMAEVNNKQAHHHHHKHPHHHHHHHPASPPPGRGRVMC